MSTARRRPCRISSHTNTGRGQAAAWEEDSSKAVTTPLQFHRNRPALPCVDLGAISPQLAAGSDTTAGRPLKTRSHQDGIPQIPVNRNKVLFLQCRNGGATSGLRILLPALGWRRCLCIRREIWGFISTKLISAGAGRSGESPSSRAESFDHASINRNGR